MSYPVAPPRQAGRADVFGGGALIFLTVGTQLKFDRLVRAVDEWAGAHPQTEVFAQIGPSDYVPRHMPWAKSLEPKAFSERFAAADVLVGHAGMGTIISCLENEKRLVVMPRMARYQEHRNDHQLATAKCFAHLKHVKAAYGQAELHDCLDHLVDLKPGGRIDKVAPPEMIAGLRAFVETGVCPETAEPTDEDRLAVPAATPAPAGPPFCRVPRVGRDRVAGVLLLGGSVAVTPWAHRVRRSLLNLPITDDQTLLERWVQVLEGTRERLGLASLPVYLMVGQGALRPFVGRDTGGLQISIQEDRGAFRGTGGTIGDIAAAFADDECLLVANGLQWMPEEGAGWIDRLLAGVTKNEADFLLQVNADGQPLDVMAARAGALRAIPRQGFVDLKEQGLRAVAQNHRVDVVGNTRWRVRSVRTEAGYLSAVAHAAASPGPFGLVEPGASMGRKAHLHNAVVLNEGAVGDGAVVVDAVVCPGETVRGDELLRRTSPQKFGAA